MSFQEPIPFFLHLQAGSCHQDALVPSAWAECAGGRPGSSCSGVAAESTGSCMVRRNPQQTKWHLKRLAEKCSLFCLRPFNALCAESDLVCEYSSSTCELSDSLFHL